MRILRGFTAASIAVVLFVIVGVATIGWTIQTTVVKNDAMEDIMSDVLTSIYEDKPVTPLEMGLIEGPDIYFGCGYIRDYLEKHLEQKEVLVSKSIVVRHCAK